MSKTQRSDIGGLDKALIKFNYNRMEWSLITEGRMDIWGERREMWPGQGKKTKSELIRELRIKARIDEWSTSACVVTKKHWVSKANIPWNLTCVDCAHEGEFS